MKGLSAPPGSLQMIPNWMVWLTFLKVGMPSRGTWMSLTSGPIEISCDLRRTSPRGCTWVGWWPEWGCLVIFHHTSSMFISVLGNYGHSCICWGLLVRSLWFHFSWRLWMQFCFIMEFKVLKLTDIMEHALLFCRKEKMRNKLFVKDFCVAPICLLYFVLFVVFICLF